MNQLPGMGSNATPDPSQHVITVGAKTRETMAPIQSLVNRIFENAIRSGAEKLELIPNATALEYYRTI